MNYKKIIILIIPAVILFSCTRLEEDLRSDIPREEAERLSNVNALLKATYDGLQLPFQDQANVWALQEHSTDEALPPTRAGDWDDNGVWRVLHTHTWNADHTYVRDVFNNLLGVVFNATNVLSFNPNPQQAAEAKFLRAFAMFTVLDLYGQVPFREPGENLLNAPKVLKGAEAMDFIITDLNSILTALPATSVAYVANRDAARVLLMKCYLNKGAFANRQAPTFAAADMTQVITLADQITATGKYSLDDNFYDNFAPNNDNVSSELIFTQQNGPGINRNGNGARSRYYSSLHYKSPIPGGGWNGFTTLADFYDKFEATDKRRGDAYPRVTDSSGLRVGLLLGQQVDKNGTPLTDRSGSRPLSFTREVKLIETGANLEVTGIRVVKYPPDLFNGDNANNDYVFFRYADVLLMKAEALLRTSSAAAGLVVVNSIRAKRLASPLGTLTADNLLDERGRELYWESWRRQDMIRFGKFLQPFQEKPATSGNERLLYPIPNAALAVNPNLEQNPGYTQ